MTKNGEDIEKRQEVKGKSYYRGSKSGITGKGPVESIGDRREGRRVNFAGRGKIRYDIRRLFPPVGLFIKSHTFRGVFGEVTNYFLQVVID